MIWLAPGLRRARSQAQPARPGLRWQVPPGSKHRTSQLSRSQGHGVSCSPSPEQLLLIPVQACPEQPLLPVPGSVVCTVFIGSAVPYKGCPGDPKP